MSAVCNVSRQAVGVLLLAAALPGCAVMGSNTPPATQAPVPVATAPAVVPTTSPLTHAAANKPAVESSVPAQMAAQTTAKPTAKTQKAAATGTPVALDNKAVVPPAAQQQFDKAIAALKSGQTTAAQATLLQLTRDYPALAAPWINLGLIEFKAGRNDAALGYFKQAVEHDAKSAAAQLYLGLGLRQAGQFKAAESAYLAALSADANLTQAHYNLGVLYDLYLQRPDLALQQYEHYQSLLETPDAKVAAWIKDLKARLNSKAKAAGASS